MPRRSFQGEFLGFLLPVCALMAFGLLIPLGFIVAESVSGTQFSFTAYRDIFQSALFARVTLNTIEIALTATIFSVLCGYPVALHLSRVSDRWRPIFMIFVLLPFWTSILVKSYSFIVVLGEAGLVNHVVRALGLPTIPMMFNRFGVVVGMTNYLIPFVVFPLLANFLAQPTDLRRAAEVMGASDRRIFWTITFPLSLPGLAAGAMMSFVISLGFFVTPALLGGRHDMMIANLIDFYTREALDWPTASAVAVLLLLTSALLLTATARLRSREAII